MTTKKVEKKVKKKEVKKETCCCENKIKKLDSMLEDVSDILGYHLERIQTLESEQDMMLSKLAQARNRLGI